MNSSNASFPHPVLNYKTDDITGVVRLDPDPPIIISNKDTYTVTINYHHDNEDLRELIKSGHAEYFCEITCSNTVFRESRMSNTPEITFEIQKKAVKGKVEFTCLIVATKPIPSYTNSQSHPDYQGYTFEIEQGDVLAYVADFSFEADIIYEKLKAVTSFMVVVLNNNENAEYTNFDFSKNKIEVQLPPEDYNLFAKDNISKDSKFSATFHSSIVLNALTAALYSFDKHKGLLWTKVIEYRLKKEDQFKNLSIEDHAKIPEIAQRLLGNPFRRLLTSLEGINNLSNPEED